MTSKLYINKVGGGDIELTAFTGRKGIPFFDGDQPLIQLGMRCADGEASQGTFKLMDPDAEVPRADFAYNLPAHKLVTWTEDASGVAIWLARGRTSTYDGGRGTVAVDDQVEFDVTVDDGNIELRGQAFTEPWVRPAETDFARVAAVRAYTLNGSGSTATHHRDSCSITVSNTHLAPNTNTVSMPAKTYPIGTQPQDVIQDCADTAGKLYSVVIHHTGASHLCLLYILETDHSTFASPIKISDELTEWDPTDLSTPVYEPHWEAGKATLYDGQQLLSGLVSIYGTEQSVFVENAANVTNYDYWVESYYDSDSTTPTQATTKANGLFATRGLTHVTHRVSVIMLAEQLALIGTGMSIQLKSAAAMGGQYLNTYQTRRIAECKFEPRADGRYWAHLELDRASRSSASSPGKAQPAATTPTVPPICEPDTPGVPVWYWTFTTNNLDDGSGTVSGGLKRPTTNPYYPIADAAFGAQAYGYNTAGNRATQKFAISGNTPYIFSSSGLLWQYTPSFRDITVQWFGSGGTVLLSTVTAIAGAGHATNSVYSEAATLTSPVGADMAVIDFSPFAGVYATDFYVSTAGTVADNDPNCIPAATWTHPQYLTPYDDSRLTAPDQHQTSAIRQTVRNNSGVILAAGHVVVPDATSDGPAVTRTTTASSTAGPIGAVIQGGADQAQIVVQWGGAASFIETNGTPADGDYLFTSTTAGVADVSATRAAGAFGRVVRDDGSGETLHVLLWGVPDASGAGAPGSSDLDWFIVTDPTYGAVGDDTADDTAAIQAAIDAAIAQGTGVVYFPIGSYKITSALTIAPGGAQDGIYLLGAQVADAANGGAVIRQATNNTSGLTITTNAYTTHIEHLGFDGPTTHASGIGISTVRNLVTKDVWVKDFATGYSLGASSFYSKLFRTGVYNCTTGFSMAAGNNNTDMVDCRVTTCTTGLIVNGAEKFSWRGGAIEGCTSYGARILSDATSETSSVLLEAIYFENASGCDDISIGDTAQTVFGVEVDSCKFTAGVTYHVDAQYVTNLLLVNNDFRDTGDTVRTQSPAAGVLLVTNRNLGVYSLSGNARIIDPETDVTPAAVAAAAAVGTSRYLPRADHAHARGTTPANTVSITDAGTYYTGTDVEAALQEIGAGGIGGAGGGQHILLADGHGTPFTFNDLLQMDDGSDFMWSDPE